MRLKALRERLLLIFLGIPRVLGLFALTGLVALLLKLVGALSNFIFLSVHGLLQSLRHLYVGFASPDAQLCEASDKRLDCLRITQDDAALVEIFSSDARFLKQRQG